MDISSKDISNQAEIGRLQDAVASLGDRLASIEPAPVAPKVDAKALKADAAARDKSIADLRHRLDARQVHLQAIDKAATELARLVLAEREARHAILSTHGALVEKELRRSLQADSTIIVALQRVIGASKTVMGDRQHGFADMGEGQRKMILQRLNAVDDIADVLS